MICEFRKISDISTQDPPKYASLIFRHHWCRKQCISVWVIMLECQNNDMQCHQNPLFVHFSILHIWTMISKNIEIFLHNFHHSLLNSSSDITESGNNVFLHEWSCWNTEIMACNVTRSHNLYSTHELWFLKKIRYFIPNSTQVCLTYLQTSLNQETMYFCMIDPAGMPKKLHVMSPKAITC